MSEVDRRLLRDIGRAITLSRVWFFLGRQDLRARFRRTFIGPLWILINLGLFVAGGGLVYGALLGQPLVAFLPHLTAGLVVWGFLSGTITEACNTFVVAEGYIKQFVFPKQVYLFRTLVSSTAVLLIGLLALAVLLLVLGAFSTVGWLCAVPGLAILLAAGLAHISLFAYLGARFRDLPHALGGLLQILFFVTPIIFPAELLSERGVGFVYRLNPLYYLIEIVRYPVLEGTFAGWDIYIVAIGYVVAVFSLAYLTARKLDRSLVFLL